MHEFGEVSNKFFDTLAQTEKLELFDLDVVQRLIKFQWPIIKQQYIINNFIPATAMLISTTFYTTFLMHDRIYGQSGDKWIISMAVEELMTVLAVVLLYQEFRQAKEQGLRAYLLDIFWNSIDVIPPLIIVMRTVAQLNGSLDKLYEKP